MNAVKLAAQIAGKTMGIVGKAMVEAVKKGKHGGVQAAEGAKNEAAKVHYKTYCSYNICFCF